MRGYLCVLLFAAGIAYGDGAVETRVFEAPSPQIFETAIKGIKVGDLTGQNQNFSLSSTWTCHAGDAFKINRWVKPVEAGIGELDMVKGIMTFGYLYEVRPVIEDGAVEYACSKYGVDAAGRTTGVCVAYECTVTKEPVFGEAEKVVHARVLRFRSVGTKYTVSFEVVPGDTQFRRELERGEKFSDRERRKWAREEAGVLFNSLKDTLEGMSRNAANSGRKLLDAESLVTDADRASSATGPAGLYRLTSVDGQGLPYRTIMMDIEIAEGSFVVHSNGTYTQTLVTGKGSLQVHGKYKLNGSSIVLFDKGGSMLAGKLDGNKELSLSTSYGRLLFAK